MQSDAQLRRWFREYNCRYFGGGLPKSTIVRYATVSGCFGDCDRRDDGTFEIRINPDTATGRKSRRFTLLHEMAHVHLWPRWTHGPYFDREMLRLANAGALKGLW